MCSLQIIPDKIVEIIVEKGIQSLGRHFGYLIHYKKNVGNLEDEKNKLQTARGTIQGKINEAERIGEVIESGVSVWQNEAEGLTQGVEAFMEEKAAKENVKCFQFSSPNINSWYKLSKEAKNKMDELKKKAEEANFIKISHPAPAPPELKCLSRGEYMDFRSRVPVFDMIIKALVDPNISMIGVYGTGGVGKTTLVTKVGDQVIEDGLFDEVMIAVVSQKPNIGKIQDDIAAQLNLKWDDKSKDRRAIQLWNRLDNGRKNLVILDDIWGELKWKEIGIPIACGKKSCKVVLTSRNQQVLKYMEFYGDLKEVYRDFPMEVLSEDEAWDLFKKKVGNIVDSHDSIHDTARKVCKECGGLPVALRAVATALKDKKLPAWENSLDKLQKSMLDQKLFTSLKLSYDFLKSKDEKSCFLLCCSFPEDAQVPIEELARHYMTRRAFHEQQPETLKQARDIVGLVFDTLKTSCLLLDGKTDDFVKMHDVVRDVAILIAKEEKAFLVKHGVKNWPEMEADEKFSAISLRFDTIRELPNELVYPKLHTLMLDCSSTITYLAYQYIAEASVKVPDMFFRRTKKLMVLELSCVIMLALPSSLEKLTELRMLCLNKCKLEDITMLKCLKNKIEVLSLRGSEIEALPHEVGELTHLRLLDLGDCDKLELIPNGVISKLVRLEELHFPLSFDNWEAATGNEQNSKVISLDELKSLPRLLTLDIHIPYLRLLPIDVFSQNLIRFNIAVGAVSGVFDDDYSLQGVMLIEGFCSDDDLNFWERLLGKPKWFNNITQLEILDCGSLKYLFSPSSARELQQLQCLVIWKGEILESVIRNERETDDEIIENVLNFSQLKLLKLMGLPCLISFYPRIKKATTGSPSLPPAQGLFNEKVALPVLEQIFIYYVPKITAIWEMQTFSSPEKAAKSSRPKLRTMRIRRCSNLVNVVKGFHNTGMRGTEEINEKQFANYILQLPQLRSLELEGLKRLSSFDNTSLVTQTRPLFNHQPTFPALKELDVEDLPRITVIWGMQTFPIPENAAESSFSRLRINNTSLTTETRPLFNHQDPFPSLEKLSIDLMPNLTEIWDKNLPPTKLFDQLRSLIVSECEKLINVFPSHMLPLIRNIETLRVSNCLEMEVIILGGEREEEMKEAANKDIIEFSKLKQLKLQRLEKLKGVCAYKSGDQLYFDVQVVFPKLSTGKTYLYLDKHSKKIFKEAISGNKEMMDAFASKYRWLMMSDDSEEKNVLEDADVSEDKDEETNKKDKAGPSEKKSREAVYF